MRTILVTDIISRVRWHKDVPFDGAWIDVSEQSLIYAILSILIIFQDE
jgi:hypothetical protein